MKIIRTCVLATLFTLCSLGAQADNPSFGAYYGETTATSNGFGAAATPAASTPAATPAAADTTAATAAQAGCKPACKGKGCMSPSCAAYDAANPGYFDNIDSQCGLPAGTAQTFAQIESQCSNTASTGKYNGMFQFSTESCPNANLNSASAQASCLCSSTSMWRNKFRAATGQNPSAGMYYLFHQQGGCGIKLANGGSARAVDVVSQCVASNMCGKGSSGCAASMRYATRAIQGNIPKSTGYNASSVTAQQFANIYLSKFSGVDDNNICPISQGAAVDTPNPVSMLNQVAGAALTAALNGTPIDSALGQAVLNSGALTQGNNLLSAAIMQMIMKGDISSMFSPILNPKYDEDGNDSATNDDTDTATPVTTTVTIKTLTDGTKSVTVTIGDTKTVYPVGFGEQMWKCEDTYSVFKDKDTTDLKGNGCSLVTAVAAKQ